MGGDQSREQDNPNFNMEEYNRRMQQVDYYQQGSALRANTALHFMSPTEHKTFTIEETQKKKIEATFAFFKKSLHIVPQAKALEIRFKYTAKAAGEVFIYLMAQEMEDEGRRITNDVHSQVRYSIPVDATTAETEFVALVPLNRTPSEMGFERPPTRGLYPIIIRFSCPLEALYSYFRPSQNFSKIQLIKSKIEKEGQGYYFEEIYGLNKSEEQGACIVCYSSPSTVTVYPCRHMCLCKDCCLLLKQKSEKCPVCRGNIDTFVNVKERPS